MLIFRTGRFTVSIGRNFANKLRSHHTDKLLIINQSITKSSKFEFDRRMFLLNKSYPDYNYATGMNICIISMNSLYRLTAFRSRSYSMPHDLSKVKSIAAIKCQPAITGLIITPEKA